MGQTFYGHPLPSGERPIEILYKCSEYCCSNVLIIIPLILFIYRSCCLHKLKIFFIGEYIRFCNNERIQIKTKLTPLA